MTNLILKKLAIKNFKRIKNLSFEFGADNNEIYGRNGSGKTTVYDSFLWLLFAKDSNGDSDFEIHPLDGYGQKIMGLDTSVEAVFLLNGYEVVIRKELKERWVKKRGAETPEFEGYETLYFYNDVPLKENMFKSKINLILDEERFRILTNPFFFQSLSWQRKRQILFSLFLADVADKSIIELMPTNEFIEKIKIELDRKTIDEYQSEISASKSKLKKLLEMIPARISELVAMKRNDLDDESVLTQKKNELEAKYKVLDHDHSALSQLQKEFQDNNSKKIVAIMKLQKKKSDIIKVLTESCYYDFNNRANEYAKYVATKDKLTSEIKRFEREQSSLLEDIEAYESDISVKRNEFRIESERSFDPSPDSIVASCPTCHRDFDEAFMADQKNKLKSDWDHVKENKLKRIIEAGNELKEMVRKSKDLVIKLDADITKLRTSLSELKPVINNSEDNETKVEATIKEAISSNLELIEIETTLTAKNEDNNETIPDNGVDAMNNIRDQKEKVRKNISEINSELQYIQQNRDIDNRLSDLKKEQSDYAQNLTNLEGIENQILEFLKFKIGLIENNLGKEFAGLSFKMFHTQINGGVVPCCDILIEGVPFDSANTAAQINGGIAIINSLSTKYDFCAPLFIDHAESVNDIAETRCQKIELRVTKNEFITLN